MWLCVQGAGVKKQKYVKMCTITLCVFQFEMRETVHDMSHLQCALQQQTWLVNEITQRNMTCNERFRINTRTIQCRHAGTSFYYSSKAECFVYVQPVSPQCLNHRL